MAMVFAKDLPKDKMPKGYQDVFSLESKPVYIYEQYKHIRWIKEYVKIVNEYIQTNYFDELEPMLNNKHMMEPAAGNYVTFYAYYYLGIRRPLINNDPEVEDSEDGKKDVRYDVTGTFWDGPGVKWDYRFIPSPFMSFGVFKKYLAFILDYSQETWTHDYMMKLPELCIPEFKAWNIRIKWTPHKVIYQLPKATNPERELEFKNFIGMVDLDKDIYLNTPFGESWAFEIGEHTEDTWKMVDGWQVGEEVEHPPIPNQEFPPKNIYDWINDWGILENLDLPNVPINRPGGATKGKKPKGKK